MLELSDEKMNLENIGGGAASELFEAELEKVLNNIKDVNTINGAREIILQVKLTPNERRDEVGLEIVCKSKLGAQPAFKSAASIEVIGGSAVANEYVQKQRPLFNNVTSIEKEGAND